MQVGPPPFAASQFSTSPLGPIKVLAGRVLGTPGLVHGLALCKTLGLIL